MKISLSLLTALGLLLPAIVNAEKQDPRNSIESRYTYTMGYRIGQMLKAQDMKKLDEDSFLQGVRAALNDDKPRLDEVEMKDAVFSYQQYMKRQHKHDPVWNLTQAKSFLEKNKLKSGVIELPSGMQYQVINAAEGKQPQADDRVLVHYHGTFMDGEVFDSSVERNEPAEFNLRGVIKGFSQALSRMHVGEKWRIFVPPSLAYGKRGSPGSIGPNELLIFEIELLAIK